MKFSVIASLDSSLSLRMTQREDFFEFSPYLAIEMKLEYLDSFPSLMMNILDSTLGR
jgi:hypothetical protein